MFKIAFSTVACPEWVLPDVARAAAEWGFQGVELRTFGYGSTEFACDPALTAAEKVRGIFAEFGVEQAVLASGVAFDEPVRPPVLGWALDTERTVRDAKSIIELSRRIQCPLVRVFGFEVPEREKRVTATRRIIARLKLAVDAARNTGVRLVVENGGSFSTAADLVELIDGAGSPLLGACYSAAVARDAGEDPSEGAALLAGRLWVAKVKDRNPGGGYPCLIGDGEMGVPAFVQSLSRQHFKGWVVVEWDRAWLPQLPPAQAVLPESARRLFEWGASPRIGSEIAAETVSM
jgi:sugar phosphate isomerase/epimerase